jgi:acyl dehydratase
MEIHEIQLKSRILRKGHTYPQFEVGQVFKHHWGRTINSGDNSLFTTLTLSYNPLYFNAEYARSNNHPGIVINPLLVLNTVFGLSVEDLSEGGGPFLGIDNLTFHQDVYENDTLTASSTVLSKRLSTSHQGFGIVAWHTSGFNQHNECVIDFHRNNLVRITAEKI